MVSLFMLFWQGCLTMPGDAVQSDEFQYRVSRIGVEESAASLVGVLTRFAWTHKTP